MSGLNESGNPPRRRPPFVPPRRPSLFNDSPRPTSPPEWGWTPSNEPPEPPPIERELPLPAKFAPLFKPARYKVFYGGRGGAKSLSFAIALIARAHTTNRRLLILCTREYQNSIQDSVHRVLVTAIGMMGLEAWFDVQKATIISKQSKTQFLFKGLRHNINEIKSTEGVDICWVEEGQAVSTESWLILDPTIRNPGSEIWVSFNPDQEDDATYKNFVVDPPPNAIVVKVNWYDNKWFPAELETLRQRMLRNDPTAYDWVWNGFTRQNAASTIFNNKYSIETFDDPLPDVQLYHGADFGFADDPSCLIRCWIRPCEDGLGDDLMIDREAWGYHIEIDDLPTLYDEVETARKWPIFADNSRPETISYLARQGFDIVGCDKWPGCVEDGIAHLRGFRKIIIHPRCVNIAQEARLYSYKVDQRTEKVLPIVVDKWNHGWDSVRYSLNGYIQSRGNLGVWDKLASTINKAPHELRGGHL